MSASTDETATLGRASFATIGFASPFPFAFAISAFAFAVSFPFFILPPPLRRSLRDRIDIALIGWSLTRGSPLACPCLGSTKVDPRLAAGNVRQEEVFRFAAASDGVRQLALAEALALMRQTNGHVRDLDRSAGRAHVLEAPGIVRVLNPRSEPFPGDVDVRLALEARGLRRERGPSLS